MSYTHIRSSERNELSILLRTGTKHKDIAKLLGKHRTTIYRECKRNSIDGRYHARIAKECVYERKKTAEQQRKKIENSVWLQKHIEKRIKKRSPEQIAGRLREIYKDNPLKQVSKDSIYSYIYTERKDLVKYLRCKKGKYRRRYGTRIREKEREKLKKRRIDERPAIVEKRIRIGDWEGDTIVGSDKEHILTHVERVSGIIFADKLGRGTAIATTKKTVARFEKIPQKKRLTCTYDNGSTFAYHEITEKYTGMTIYFANPYHSWERGCNENANGLLREYFPKGTPFATVTQKDVNKAVYELNHRPRKRLNYLTPYEVFYGKVPIKA